MSVHDKQNGDRTDHSDCVPTLLAVFDAIRQDYMKRVVPNSRREFKRNAVA